MSLRSWFTRSLLALGVSAVFWSCSGAQRWTSDPADYDAYRRVRLAKGVEERLRQGWRYLQADPRGAYRSEVEPWFVVLEEQMRRQSWNYEAKLERLLELLPDGPHAEPMRLRLAQLNTLKVRRATGEREFLRGEQERASHFERAKVARAAFIRGVQATLRELAAIGDLGRPVAEWNSNFKQRLFEEAPLGYCEPSHCAKHFSGKFDIPAGRGLMTRATSYDVILLLDGGLLAAVELSGPQLFSRLSEAANLRAVAPGDLQARVEAIAIAVQLVALAVEAEFPEARCAAEAVSPVVLARSCAGRKLTAELDEQAALDRIRIVATTSGPSAAPD